MLLAVVDADDDDGVGDQPTVVAFFIEHLQAALDDARPFRATLRASASVAAELKPQLRALLHYHCGVQTLRTRQLMVDLQSL